MRVEPLYNFDQRFYVIHEKENERHVVESRISGTFKRRSCYLYRISSVRWEPFWCEDFTITEKELKQKIGPTFFFNSVEALLYIKKTAR